MIADCRPASRWRVLVVLIAAVAGGCLTDEDSGPEPAAIAKVAETDAQTAPGRSRLPLRVTVVSRTGEAVPRVGVRWSITSEPGVGGSLSDSVTVTDGTGTAQVRYTLSPVEGTSLVRAELENDLSKAVVFTVTISRTPTLEAVMPMSFRGGDPVVAAGTNLTAATSFSVGGVEVQPETASLSDTSVTILIPSCLALGPVAFRAHAGNGASDPVFGEYTASTGLISLGVGEFVSLSPAVLQGCATFAGAGSDGAEYLIAVQSVSGNPGESVAYRLTADAPTVPIQREYFGQIHLRHAERFDLYLRQLEREIARLPRPAAADVPPPSAPAAVIMLGQRRNFEVCGSITCSVEDFRTVRAEARYVGSHAVIYEDIDAPEPGLTAEDFDELGSMFDDDLYGVATRAFGAESDVDNDDRVAILLTPVVNALTPKEMCEQSFIAGFFFAVDINPGSINDPRSNQAEVFFAIAPDPEGTVTCSFSVQRILQQVPVTFIHEFQHMINFHQHAMLRAGVLEVLWLNESMSHLSEELGGLHFRDLDDQARFNRFVGGNLINVYDYLLNPGAVFVLPPEDGTGTLQERGSGWLFLRWLVDQFGDGLPRILSETDLTGADNVERATGVPLSELLSQWFLATWVSDLPDSILADSLKPVRLRYTTWRFRTTFESFNEQSADRFPLPFPLVPVVLRSPSFDRQGVLRAGSGDYYRVLQSANDAGFRVAFTDPAGATLSGAVPRINVMRIR